MEMTIEIPSDIESQLAKEAEKLGVDPAGFIQSLLTNRLQAEPLAPSVSNREAELLKAIDIGFSKEKMERYMALFETQREGQLSNEELKELRKTSLELESLNLRRITALSDLAELRGVALSTVMSQLGIDPPDVI